ncbi:MAG: hypothetical protein YK1309IOTA_1760002 [Marine Group I thaumarchaeote]|nr:MAG: hypothetical protein YK1309IOTA_1760002 [Marine Group I thaumarchaeote]
MIVVLNDHIRGIISNEEILWSVLEKTLDDCVGISTNELKEPLANALDRLNPSLVIQNSILGKISDYKTISFLQDPLIAMKRHFDSLTSNLKEKIRRRETYSDKIRKQFESFQKSIKVTNSNYIANMYQKAGKFKVIPMGVDHSLFRPLDKKEMRRKYKIPLDRKVNIFVGSQHPVKGLNEILKMIQDDPSIFWILILKDSKIEAGHNYLIFQKISQTILAELYNCADTCVSRSITESFGLAVVEAMFCGTKIDVPKTGIFWDWEPEGKDPRKEAFSYGLDKDTWMKNWKQLVNSC